MRLINYNIKIDAPPNNIRLLSYCAAHCARACDSTPIVRWAITAMTRVHIFCEFTTMEVDQAGGYRHPTSIFQFNKRRTVHANTFNVVMLVPTGAGCIIGGHAGDATPVVRAMAGCCDTLITHPNVVNASDINEMTENMLYVEGSVIARMLMGQIGLARTRANRVLVIIDGGAHDNAQYVEMAINAVNAARATIGLQVPEVVLINTLHMTSMYSTSGCAVGKVEGVQGILSAIADAPPHDAIALASVIDVPIEYHTDYYKDDCRMVNPWGGVEAMLTHALSCTLNVPTAHAPLYESEAVANIQLGVVNPRMAAETVSLAFFHCVLKGLHRSPRIVLPDCDDTHAMMVADIGCLVIPDGCLGIPTLAALDQGIPVIVVRENRSTMKNDLRALPWAPGQFVEVENYWEALGVLTALRTGVQPSALRNQEETLGGPDRVRVRRTNYAPPKEPSCV